MEQHPVPQNIASFEFKLIGDITLKQFAFVGLGLFAGYLATRFTLLPAMKLPGFTEFGFSDDVHTANREPIEDIVARVKLRRT